MATETFKRELAASLRWLGIEKGRSVRIWVADEMRYGLPPVTRRVWSLRGTRVVVPVLPRYDWAHCYGAGFHPSDGESGLPANVRLLKLPACSPELNPVEKLWDVVKDGICNRLFTAVSDLQKALSGVLAECWSGAGRVSDLVGAKGWLVAQASYLFRSVDCVTGDTRENRRAQGQGSRI